MNFFFFLEGHKRYKPSTASDPRILYGAAEMGEFAQRRAKNKWASMWNIHIKK
jgi:hypothetical protein